MKTTRQHNLTHTPDASCVWLPGGFGTLGLFSAESPAGGMPTGERYRIAGERRPVVSTDRRDCLNPGSTASDLG